MLLRVGCHLALAGGRRLSRHHDFAESKCFPAVLERRLVAEGVWHIYWVMVVKCPHGMNEYGGCSV